MQGQAQQLAEWYKKSARPFLEKNAPERIADFDRDCARLEQSSAALSQELSVCFLGNSGVGKSTLINALVADGKSIVPSGGVGPLTAQALTVRYGEDPRLQAEYHGPGRLWQLVFGLQNSWKAELGQPKVDEDAPADLLAEVEPEPEPGSDEEPPARKQEKDRGRLETLRVAELIVTGGQGRDISVQYLVDSLREALGLARKWGTAADPADNARMARLRKALAFGKAGQIYTTSGNPEDLKQELKDHASGFLAPLIKTATVWWSSSLLQDGVTLIDLPGLGVVGDPRPEVTRKYIREQARVVVLVVDNRGVTEPVARLLRESEFLAKLLHTTDDPTGNPVLMVAVTRVDDIASTEYLADEDREFPEHFASVCERTIPMVRQHLRGEVEGIWATDGELGESKKAVINNLLDTLQVYPLSAVEYRKLAAGKRADLEHPSQTNVPSMLHGLRSLREAQKQELHSKIQIHYETLLQGVSSAVRLVQAQWEDESHRAEEIEQLARDLATFIGPLRRRFDTQQGQYREFLRATIPGRITDLVKTAKERARNQIQKYLNRLGQTHWAVLRASVRRGGRYSGASDVDLQREFALMFEEPIAETWGKEILKDIRKRTNEYANGALSLVEEVSDWAKEQGARVQQKVVEAQRDAIRADCDRLKTVGREMMKEVRDKNATLLIDTIDGPIRNRCRKFVDAHQDAGPGVKRRILELYDELADQITDAAEKPAIRILNALFKEVEAEILDAFDAHRDPLESIAEAIVDSQQKYLERSDAQKRKGILQEAGIVLDELPAIQDAVAGD
jgi:GTP-binding protein EngB required for normal cell division